MNKKKLAIWILAFANPIICWSIAYLLWAESDPERYKTATFAAKVVIGIIIVFLVLSALGGASSFFS